MDPVSGVLTGLGALGGIFGRRKQKYMDPAMYNQLFGAKAMGARTQELVNQISNSPYGQQLMQQAAEQGQGLQTGLNKAAAENGFGPAGGASSGASDFGVSAGGQAVNALQRGVTSNLTQNAMPIAQQMVQNEGNLALSNMAAQNAEPTLMGRIGNAASTALSGVSGAKSAGADSDYAAMLKKLIAGGGGAGGAGAMLSGTGGAGLAAVA
jgi:hypothetical protein